MIRALPILGLSLLLYAEPLELKTTTYLHIRESPSAHSPSLGVLPPQSILKSTGVRVDGFYQLANQEGYIGEKYVIPSGNLKEEIVQKIYEKIENDLTQDPSANHSQELDKGLTLALESATKANEKRLSSKEESILLHSPEMAKLKPKEALIEHLTKLPSPLPLRSKPQYARLLLFPYTTPAGDYHDYSFIWVKIKEEEFVLGNREGKE